MEEGETADIIPKSNMLPYCYSLFGSYLNVVPVVTVYNDLFYTTKIPWAKQITAALYKIGNKTSE